MSLEELLSKVPEDNDPNWIQGVGNYPTITYRKTYFQKMPIYVLQDYSFMVATGFNRFYKVTTYEKATELRDLFIKILNAKMKLEKEKRKEEQKALRESRGKMVTRIALKEGQKGADHVLRNAAYSGEVVYTNKFKWQCERCKSIFPYRIEAENCFNIHDKQLNVIVKNEKAIIGNQTRLKAVKWTNNIRYIVEIIEILDKIDDNYTRVKTKPIKPYDVDLKDIGGS